MMKTARIRVSAILDGTFTLEPGNYQIERVGLDLVILVEVPDNEPLYDEALPPIGLLNFGLQRMKRPKVVWVPSFWRRFRAARAPFIFSAPDTFPRRTGRRSRDGRWFRGDRQLAMVGVN